MTNQTAPAASIEATREALAASLQKLELAVCQACGCLRMTARTLSQMIEEHEDVDHCGAMSFGVDAISGDVIRSLYDAHSATQSNYAKLMYGFSDESGQPQPAEENA